MPRVSICFYVFFALASAASDPYTDAKRLISTYSAQSTNLTTVLHLLEASAAQKNPEAYLKLGEFYLFGFPLSPSNQLYASQPEPSFIQSGHKFKRDIGKAVKYFRKAKNMGAKDASFYLSFLLHQGLILEELDKQVPMASDYLFSHKSMFESGLNDGSEMSKLSAVSGFRECINAEKTKFPDFLSANFSVEFHKFPYFEEEEKCQRSCRYTVQHASQLAAAIIDLYEQIGSFPSYDLGPLHSYFDQIANGKPEKALLMLEKGAEIGDKEATSVLASSYFRGNTALAITANQTLAAQMYEKAAEEGNIEAMEAIGTMYSKGQGVEKNTTKALSYLLKAAELGSAKAHNALAYLYLAGDGVPKDTQEAVQHFQIAANKGDVESQSSLSTLYFSGKVVPKDPKHALEYLLRAVAAGHPPAIYQLGKMFMDGSGVMQSCENALNLFWLVATKGPAGRFLQQGYYFIRAEDYEGAYLSFAVAAALGYESGQLSAAYMWEKDLVPFKCKYGKEVCAGFYYAMAVLLNNNTWARYRLGDLAYYGSSSFPPSFQQAFESYSLSLLPEARHSLAYMYEQGLGVTKNLTAAKEIYEELIAEADIGLLPREVQYPAYLSLIRLRAQEIFTQGVELALDAYDSYVKPMIEILAV
jgi:TPR repeat protein